MIEYQGEEEDATALVLDEFREKMKKLINNLFARYISRVVADSGGEKRMEDTTLEERLAVLLMNNMIPGATLIGDTVRIKRTLLAELDMDDKINLKSLAEVLAAEYRVAKIAGKTTRVLEIEMHNLVNFLLESY